MGGRSLWSQVPEPPAGLARTGPTIRGRKSCFLAAFVSGGNDSVLETDPEQVLGVWPFLPSGQPALERKDGRVLKRGEHLQGWRSELVSLAHHSSWW